MKTNISPEYSYVRGFHTNGSDWKLFEVHERIIKKTDFFQPTKKSSTSKRGFRPYIFEDINHIMSVIGLIRFALSKFINIINIIISIYNQILRIILL